MTEKARPVLAVTMGDPAGVGPEIVVRALADREVRSWCRPLVLGDPAALAEAARSLGIDLEITGVSDVKNMSDRTGKLDVLPLSDLAEADRRPGKPTPAGGAAAAAYIETGAHLVLTGRAEGLVTGPISKEALRGAGYDFPGHTEFLAARAGVRDVVMMMAGAQLRVALVTIHVALADVFGLLTPERILKTARITHEALVRRFGLPRPRLALAGLNPHAGEHGLFGREEETVLGPALSRAESLGLDLSGPHPADTVFYRAASGEFDAVIALYHDQGLIPFKLLHFTDGVNVTLGLPFIRTSVDHGTAFDLAGRGRADYSSLKAALGLAARMAGISAQTGSD